MANKTDGVGWPEPKQGDFIIDNFRFGNGSNLPKLRIHYRTLGTLKKNRNGMATNAVLVLHGTTSSGGSFFRDAFAGQLFNHNQLLSAEEYFLVLPDSIGHGDSSKPSDGLKAKFPRYGYLDMVRAQHMLLTQHLNVNHLRLVMGTSMGGMHSWVWATVYNDFMDAVMPLASLPCQISGRNRMWRKHAIESIRNDPDFASGNYTVQPRGFVSALHVFAWMTTSPLRMQIEAPDRESADRVIDRMIQVGLKEKDGNDFAYAFDASWDYDPRPGLKDIRAFVTGVNFADDQVNPPELNILEEEMRKVEKGKAVVMPITKNTVGHGTHSLAYVWKEYLIDLLDRSRRNTNTDSKL